MGRRKSVVTQSLGHSASLAAHTLITRILTYAVGLPGSVMLARGLGAEGRGVYQIPVTAATILVLVASLGLPQAMFRTWTPDRLRVYSSMSLSMGLTLGAAGSLVGWLLFIAAPIGALDPVPDAAAGMVFAAFPLMVTVGLQSAVLTYAGRARAVNESSAAAVCFQTTLFVAGALTGTLTVTRTCGIFAAGIVLQFVWTRVALRATGEPESRQETPSRDALVGLGLKLQPYILANQLLLRVDVLLLAALSSTLEVGLYTVSLTLAELTWNATDAILVPTIERSSRSAALDEGAATSDASRITVLVGLAGSIALVVGAPLLVPLMYGVQFSDSVPVVIALLPGVVAMGVWRVCSLTTVKFAHTRVQTGISGAALAVNVLLNLALIPAYGAIGAAAASSIAYTIAAAMTVRWVASHTARPVREFVVPRRGDLRRLARIPRAFLGRT